MDPRSQRGQILLEMIWFLIFIFGFFALYLTWGETAKRKIEQQQESRETRWYKK